MTYGTNNLYDAAISTLFATSNKYGIFASQENNDNYKRIWARDLAITSLALLQSKEKSMLKAARNGLKLLASATAPNGQIPSNISIDNTGEITGKSFGGPVGRTDCGFWWIIAAINLLKDSPDTEFERLAKTKTKDILNLAETWEFNQKHLMYLPMSSNWADEYILEGYVLFDQLLRVWALELAANYWSNESYQEKANQIKMSIRFHFLLEDVEYKDALFTQSMLQQISSVPFISAFTPGEFNETRDAWSMSLLLLLNIPGLVKRKWIIEQFEQEFEAQNSNGIPAFWPTITEQDSAFSKLQNNHAYLFKNKPHHFHNGGIWPVVNAFVINALKVRGANALADAILNGNNALLSEHSNNYPFAEYFNSKDFHPGGIKNLCFSASAVILSHPIDSTQGGFLRFFPFGESELKASQSILSTTIILAQAINYLQPANSPIVLAIAGESGSGKTVTARGLQQLYKAKGKKVIILHLDDYFKLPPAQNHQKRLNDFEWVGKGEVRLDLLQKHIDLIASKVYSHLEIPKMNWSTDKEETELIDIENCDVLIIEGTYSLFFNNLTFRIFMEHSYHDTVKNRLQRNREPLSEYNQKILEKEHHIIKTQRDVANMIIKKDYSLEVVSKSNL